MKAKQNKKKTAIELFVLALGGYGIYKAVTYSTGKVNSGAILPDTSHVTPPSNKYFPQDPQTGVPLPIPMPDQTDILYNKSDATQLHGIYERPAIDITTFAERYKPVFIKRSQETGILPEVAFAQAISESTDELTHGKNDWTFGASVLALDANNYFGIKADPSWRGETYYTTADGSTHVGFRSYATPEDSINDYYDFMAANGYADAVKGLTSASDQIDAIAARGYASNPSYAGQLKKIAPHGKMIFDTAQSKTNVMTAGVPVLGAVIALAVGYELYRNKNAFSRPKISGAGEWFKENPLATSIIAGAIVAVGVGYAAGKYKTENTPADLQIDLSTLPDPTGIKYQDIADQTEAFCLHDTFVSGELLDLVKNLSADELKAVAKAFGTRQYGLSTFGVKIPLGSRGSIFYFYNNTMSNFPPMYYLDKMKTIWQPTGLWSQ